MIALALPDPLYSDPLYLSNECMWVYKLRQGSRWGSV